jgi:hypothetical protein
VRPAFTGPVLATPCHWAAHSVACILLRALLECAEIGPSRVGARAGSSRSAMLDGRQVNIQFGVLFLIVGSRIKLRFHGS